MKKTLKTTLMSMLFFSIIFQNIWGFSGGLQVHAQEKQVILTDTARIYSQEKINELKAEITSKALAYIESQRNENGSIGNSRLINDTAEAVSILSRYTEADMGPSAVWMQDMSGSDNVDEWSRMAVFHEDSIMVPEDYPGLETILPNQNRDGGYGLTCEFQSDVLDSLLVLEAMNRQNPFGYQEEGWRIVLYLARQVRQDGSLGYTAASGGSRSLTARALIQMCAHTDNYRISSNLIQDAMKRMGQYVSTVPDLASDWSEYELESYLYQTIALAEYQGVDDPEAVIQTLFRIQTEYRKRMEAFLIIFMTRFC